MYPSLHSNTAFSNTQQVQVTQLLFEGQCHIAYIAPTGWFSSTNLLNLSTHIFTGSGKTTPPILAVKYLDKGKTTIFLLPLVAMHIQYEQCAQEFGVNVEHWTPKTSMLAPPTLILATIDEAHLTPLHSDFRPVMSLLQWIASIPVQILLMTATLPPSLEEPLFQVVGLTSVTVIRALTPCPNISFRVVRAPFDIEATVQDQFSQAMSSSKTSRLLIFCLTVREVQCYADLLDVPACHSYLGYEQLNNILDEFRNNDRVRALATTSILGVGLNVPSVTHTIHVEFPRNVLSFIQEAGRAGRRHGNQSAFSTIIPPSSIHLPSFPMQDHFGVKVLHMSLIDDTVCRRIALQSFLDGQAEPCALLSGNVYLCDVCEIQSRNLLEGLYFANPVQILFDNFIVLPSTHLLMTTEHSKLHYAAPIFQPDQESEDIEFIHCLLRYFSHACVACAIRRDKEQSPRHLFRDCQTYPSPMSQSSLFRDFKKDVTYSTGTCYQCGIPQHVRQSSVLKF